jgi:hypothetical protein
MTFLRDYLFVYVCWHLLFLTEENKSGLDSVGVLSPS